MLVTVVQGGRTKKKTKSQPGHKEKFHPHEDSLQWSGCLERLCHLHPWFSETQLARALSDLVEAKLPLL